MSQVRAPTPKVLFVTGAASGIGAVTSRLAAARGWHVAAADIDADGAADLCAGLEGDALPLALDVREAEAWERSLDAAAGHFGRVDVLVNNAGLIHFGWAHEMQIERHRHMLDVNVLGVIAGVRAALPRMLHQGGGQIVNVASLASFVPMTGQATYAASKHAVRAFHYGVALEQRDAPVDFTLICPPAVETPMLARQVGDDANALAFADPSVPAEQVGQAIVRAVERRPSEVLIPAWRGRFLRAVGTQPALMRRLVPRAERIGRRKLEARRRREAAA